MGNIIGKYFIAVVGQYNNGTKVHQVYLAGQVIKQSINCCNDYIVKIISSSISGYDSDTTREVFLDNNKQIKVKYFDRIDELLAKLI